MATPRLDAMHTPSHNRATITRESACSQATSWTTSSYYSQSSQATEIQQWTPRNSDNFSLASSSGASSSRVTVSHASSSHIFSSSSSSSSASTVRLSHRSSSQTIAQTTSLASSITVRHNPRNSLVFDHNFMERPLPEYPSYTGNVFVNCQLLVKACERIAGAESSNRSQYLSAISGFINEVTLSVEAMVENGKGKERKTTIGGPLQLKCQPDVYFQTTPQAMKTGVLFSLRALETYASRCASKSSRIGSPQKEQLEFLVAWVIANLKAYMSAIEWEMSFQRGRDYFYKSSAVSRTVIENGIKSMRKTLFGHSGDGLGFLEWTTAHGLRVIQHRTARAILITRDRLEKSLVGIRKIIPKIKMALVLDREVVVYTHPDQPARMFRCLEHEDEDGDDCTVIEDTTAPKILGRMWESLITVFHPKKDEEETPLIQPTRSATSLADYLHRQDDEDKVSTYSEIKCASAHPPVPPPKPYGQYSTALNTFSTYITNSVPLALKQIEVQHTSSDSIIWAGFSVEACTLPTLIGILTDPTEAHLPDYACLVEILFRTFRAIVEPEDLADLLGRRFHLCELPQHRGTAQISPNLKKSYRRIIRLKVTELCLIWRKHYWVDKTDGRPDVLQKLERILADNHNDSFMTDMGRSVWADFSSANLPSNSLPFMETFRNTSHYRGPRIIPRSKFLPDTPGDERYHVNRKYKYDIFGLIPAVRPEYSLQEVRRIELQDFVQEFSLALTSLEKEVFDAISVDDFACWTTSRDPSGTFPSSIAKWQKLQEAICITIAHCVVHAKYPHRYKVVEFFLEVAQKCADIKNWSSASSILEAFNDNKFVTPNVSEMVSQKHIDCFQNLNTFISNMDLRYLVGRSLSESLPMIPPRRVLDHGLRQIYTHALANELNYRRSDDLRYLPILIEPFKVVRGNLRELECISTDYVFKKLDPSVKDWIKSRHHDRLHNNSFDLAEELRNLAHKAQSSEPRQDPQSQPMWITQH
ncbi:hypothetical protein C8Q75DRAFT_806971 [Abortiporus biennis]|nr:hypothetical protein C8Q75DRAFT_806971 [Abortiporus biennis]